MSRWRKKRIIVDAWQFLPVGQREEPPAWIESQWFYEDSDTSGKAARRQRGTPHMLIPTPAGPLRADLTDWVIRGVKGDIYPCNAVVFAASYEPVH